MASNTKNVKLGVCKVFFDGVDLGYTKGGVEVSVKTETHKVNVDQFGKTTVNEYIMGRELTAKVPLVETTLENLAATMPGATLTLSGGVVATGSITIATNPVALETITVGGSTITFRSALLAAGAVGADKQVLIGATAAATAANLVAALNGSADVNLSKCFYFTTIAGGPTVVSIRYGNQLIYGARGNRTTEGNAFTLATGTAAAKVTVSGATLTGGANSTNASIDVPTGVGLDLLNYARELRLHPKTLPDSNKSEDFIIPLAATAGAMNFSYKLEDERVFDCEFGAYPDAAGLLFAIGE